MRYVAEQMGNDTDKGRLFVPLYICPSNHLHSYLLYCQILTLQPEVIVTSQAVLRFVFAEMSVIQP